MVPYVKIGFCDALLDHYLPVAHVSFSCLQPGMGLETAQKISWRIGNLLNQELTQNVQV